MEQNPEFAWGLIASMYLGNVMLLVVNIFCIPAFASIARVPFRVLGPIIIVLCVIGTFAVNKSLLDVQIMLACGVLGFFMRQYGLSPAALVIALVLGPLAEETLRQTHGDLRREPRACSSSAARHWGSCVFIVFLLTHSAAREPSSPGRVSVHCNVVSVTRRVEAKPEAAARRNRHEAARERDDRRTASR